MPVSLEQISDHWPNKEIESMILVFFGLVLYLKEICIHYQLREKFGLAGILFSFKAQETYCNTHNLLFIATLYAKVKIYCF